jgi:glutamate N-acetyltransferase / amino-acid N-acetyltransferase
LPFSAGRIKNKNGTQMNADREQIIHEIVEVGVTSPAGFLAGTAACGLKQSGRPDIAIVYSERNCTAAAVFTQNQVVAAPVIIDRETLEMNTRRVRGVVANAGNANACTGAAGLEAARQVQQESAFLLGCQPEQLFLLSTGVIGVPLPVDKVMAGVEAAAAQLRPENGLAAAQAIMTTDTRPKQMAVQVELPGGVVTIGGMAKGSGMIHPNMATMLAVITTDAAVPDKSLQRLLRQAVDQSFNRISIDGDTSTNDTVLLLANGASGVEAADKASLAAFSAGLTHVCSELAKMIVADGEGASKFVTIWVMDAFDGDQAHRVAQTIATSPLVKTALAGGDPNWGRILAAAGRAGVVFDQNCVALWVGRAGEEQTLLQLVAEGTPTAYNEAEAAAIFAQREIEIHLDLGMGMGEATVWTCDLTHEYVTINADYRT